MRVDDRRASSVWHYRLGNLGHGQHRTFDMEMPVDEPRSQVGSFQIDHLTALVFSQPNHTPIFDSDVRGVNLAAENIDEIGILKNHFSRLFAAGNAELLLDVTHNASRQYLPSRQRNSHCRLPPNLLRLPQSSPKHKKSACLCENTYRF